MCDRWLGHLLETLRVLGRLEDTLLVVSSDHGHSLWERCGYIGKRGYPSDPEVVDVPLFIRHPRGLGAGTVRDAWAQHHDLAATALEAAGLAPPDPIDGRSLWQTAFENTPGPRDHVTVGWGAAMTVITERWWLNCKVNGRGALLFDRSHPDPFAVSLHDEGAATVRDPFAFGVADAAGSFPDYLLAQAESLADAPGCSPIAARA